MNQTGTWVLKNSHNIGDTYSQDMGDTFSQRRCAHTNHSSVLRRSVLREGSRQVGRTVRRDFQAMIFPPAPPRKVRGTSPPKERGTSQLETVSYFESPALYQKHSSVWRTEEGKMRRFKRLATDKPT